MTQGILPFKYENDKRESTMTGFGGLPVYLDMAQGIRVIKGDVFLCPTASGVLVSEYRKHSRLRKRNDSTGRTSTHTNKEKGK